MRLRKSLMVAVGLVWSCAMFAGEETVTSEKGRTFVLSFDGDHWTRAVQSTTICADQDVGFATVKLWMPDHGHGSTPTQVEAITSRCVHVTKINFVMLGTWELKVATNDGDKAVFKVVVE